MLEAEADAVDRLVAEGALGLGGVLGVALAVGLRLAGFVGAGLLFASATGTCAMANLLRLAPWNRAASRPAHV